MHILHMIKVAKESVETFDIKGNCRVEITFINNIWKTNI